MSYPIGQTKIDRLGEIEALIESGVVSARKRHNEFSSALIRSGKTNEFPAIY